jgi:hypothetical protein
MTGDPTRDGEPPAEHAQDEEADEVRRRRRAEVFGDVLPEGTRDDRGDGWSEREPGGEASEQWLRRQVPPHHG